MTEEFWEPNPQAWDGGAFSLRADSPQAWQRTIYETLAAHADSTLVRALKDMLEARCAAIWHRMIDRPSTPQQAHTLVLLARTWADVRACLERASSETQTEVREAEQRRRDEAREQAAAHPDPVLAGGVLDDLGWTYPWPGNPPSVLATDEELEAGSEPGYS